MGCDGVVSCVGTISGNILGFAAKQTLIVRGLGTIRNEIHRIVADVAERHFGSWIGSAIGFQASLVFALPVASFIGDLLWTCISEVVFSVVTITSELLGIIKRRSEWFVTPLLTAVRIAAVAISYFVKCLVCNYAMPFVEKALGEIFHKALPLIIQNHVALHLLTPLVSAGATVFTPNVTIFAADVVGFVVQTLIYHLAKTLLYSALCERSQEMPEDEKRIPVRQ